jgi:hypothetical protein
MSSSLRGGKDWRQGRLNEVSWIFPLEKGFVLGHSSLPGKSGTGI